MVWGDSAAAQRWGGGQDPTPGRGLVRGRMGPAMVLEQSEKDASQRSGGCCGEVAPEQELTAFLHLTPPTPNLRAELESHLWVPLDDPSGHGSWWWSVPFLTPMTPDPTLLRMWG